VCNEKTSINVSSYFCYLSLDKTQIPLKNQSNDVLRTGLKQVSEKDDANFFYDYVHLFKVRIELPRNQML
jgi:hypothetical protein